VSELIEGSALQEAPASASPTRGVIFLSHATPEENTFAAWLAAQLVSAGYEVWCDLTKLLGGERFWRGIEDAISNHTFRFLFVSTLITHTKPGTRRELDLAFKAQAELGLADFVIPLKLDEFPFSGMDERLRDLNIMRFDEGWPAALSKLLKLLERDGAPKSPLATPASVTDWYRRSIDQTRRVQTADENAYSNWFRVRLPKMIRFHDLGVGPKRIEDVVSGFPWPHRILGEWLVTFAPTHEVNEALGPLAEVTRTHEVRTEDLITDGDTALDVASGDASNIVTDLLRKAWDNALKGRGLESFEMASGEFAWFFKNGQLDKNRAYFTPPGVKKPTYRQLVGAKSKRTLEGEKAPDGFWHYAVSGLPQLHPFPRLVLRHHVIFSDDGTKPWQSADRMHKARRSVCKQWWNAAWRDRLFAITANLGGDTATLTLMVSEDESFEVRMQGMSFTSPRRFFEDNECGLNESVEIELVEDADELEDDDVHAS
jgi:hypothetical protein